MGVSLTTGEEVGGTSIKVHLEQVEVCLSEQLLKGDFFTPLLILFLRLPNSY